MPPLPSPANFKLLVKWISRVIKWYFESDLQHLYTFTSAGSADAKLCIYQSRSCSTSHLRLRGKIIFPPWASVLSSIDQCVKWVSGQEGGGGEINFPGFPNLHSAAKKSICLIYRETAGGGEIAATDQHNVQLRLEGICCHACIINTINNITQISQGWRKKGPGEGDDQDDPKVSGWVGDDFAGWCWALDISHFTSHTIDHHMRPFCHRFNISHQYYL